MISKAVLVVEFESIWHGAPPLPRARGQTAICAAKPQDRGPVTIQGEPGPDGPFERRLNGRAEAHQSVQQFWVNHCDLLSDSFGYGNDFE